MLYRVNILCITPQAGFYENKLQPDNYSGYEYCLTLASNDLYRLADRNCDDFLNLYALCETDHLPVTTSATTVTTEDTEQP